MKRRSKTQIQSLIAEWRQSGQSQPKFCRIKSISLSTFQTWLKKESKGSGSIAPAFLFVEVLDDSQVAYPQSRSLVLKTSYGLILEGLLHDDLLNSPVINADETTIQVLNEPNKTAESKSHMWCLARSGKQPIVFYRYYNNRSR